MGHSGGVPARVVLGVLAFFMFLVTQMIRATLYIAVVSMVNHGNNSTTDLPSLRSRGLDWEAENMAWFLSAFYFCYWMTELPGGLLAQWYGGRRVLGAGVLAAGILNLALPLCCRVNYWLAVAVRAMQGLALGVTWPAMHALSAHWVPATERSKFMVSYHGAAVGSAVVYPLSGQLIATLGWESVFYATGGLTLLWSVAWWTLVYDIPAEHPRISADEKIFLQETTGRSVTAAKGLRTPWMKILSSAPFWAALVASLGVMWGSITLSMQLPAYFNEVHHMDIKTNGLVLCLPELCKFLFGLCFSSMVDRFLLRGTLSITVVRKISIGVSEYVPALLLALLGYCVSDTVLAVTLLTMSTAAAGASSSGNLANIVDISPNFAGTLLGLIKTLSVIPGVVSPLVASKLLEGDDPGLCWGHVFGVTSAVHVVCCSVFVVLGSGEVQPWNQAPTDLEPGRDHLVITTSVKEELEPLR